MKDTTVCGRPMREILATSEFGRMLAAVVLTAGLLLPAAAAQALEVFDFTTEPYPGSSNGVMTLSAGPLSPAVFTNENGRALEIRTFYSGGSVAGYALDTFGSGPPPFGDTQIFGQRAFFFYGNTGEPVVNYNFWTTVKLISATFVLYNEQQNLSLKVEPGTALSTEFQYFWSTDGYDDFLAGGPAPLSPPEITVSFDNTVPLTDQISMRSLGGSGAALKTLVVEPVDLGGGDPTTAVPVPAAGLLLLSGLGVAAAFARRHPRV